MPRTHLKPYILRMFTPVRIGVTRRLWRSYESHVDILAKLNSFPGPPVSHHGLRLFAHSRKWRRPLDFRTVDEQRRRSPTGSGVAFVIAQVKKKNRGVPRPRPKKPAPPPKPPRTKKPSTRRFAPGMSMGRPPSLAKGRRRTKKAPQA